MKYEVTISRFGTASVDANSVQEAMALAHALPTDRIDWADDWTPTDAAPADDDGNGTENGRIAVFDLDGTVRTPMFRTRADCVPVMPVLDFARKLKDAGFALLLVANAGSQPAKNERNRWLKTHPEVCSLFNDVIYFTDRNAKQAYIKDMPIGTVTVDDDMGALLFTAHAGVIPIHVSHIMAGRAASLAGLEPWTSRTLSAAARESADHDSVCIMANTKAGAQEAFDTWKALGLVNVFLLTEDTPARELNMSIRAIEKLQASRLPVHVACTPHLAVGVNLSFNDFYREDSEDATATAAQRTGRFERKGDVEANACRTVDDRPGQETPEDADGAAEDWEEAAIAKAKALADTLAEAASGLRDAAAQAANSPAAMDARKKIADALSKAANKIGK